MSAIKSIIIAAIAAVIAVFLTVAVVELTSIKPMKNEIKRLNAQIDKQNAIIVKLASIEKYKIENRFDKLKAKDGQVVMSLDNNLSALELDKLGKLQDSLKVKEPPNVESFWSKLKFW